MLQVLNDSTIKLTRGDSAYLEIPLTYDTGEAYELQQDDQLSFGLKRSIKDGACCLLKTVSGTNIFKLLPEDTANLDFASYKYDVQLNTADGDVFTVINNATFIVLPEVV